MKPLLNNLKNYPVCQQIFKKPKLYFNPSCCQVLSYCETEIVPQDTDILLWWKEHENVFPDLAKLVGYYFDLKAKDILAIPGFAAPSERINSEAREMLPYTRNRLGKTMIEATLVSKSFLKEYYF